MNERPAKRGAVRGAAAFPARNRARDASIKTCGRGAERSSDGARVGKRAEVAGRGVSKKRTKLTWDFLPFSRATAEADVRDDWTRGGAVVSGAHPKKTRREIRPRVGVTRVGASDAVCGLGSTRASMAMVLLSRERLP